MAVKSYKDRIRTNWDELSLERQEELKDIWNGHIADCIMAQIKKYPAKHQPAIFNSVIKRLASQ